MMTSSTSIIGNQVDFRLFPAAATLEIHRLTSASPCMYSTRRIACCSISTTKPSTSGAEMAPEDHARDGDDQAEAGVVQGDGNTVSQLLGIGAGRRLRTEDFDHADDRAEQAHQRADRGDGAERGQVALELVGNGAAGLLDRLLHHLAGATDVAQASGQHATERRMALKFLEQLARCRHRA